MNPMPDLVYMYMSVCRYCNPTFVTLIVLKILLSFHFVLFCPRSL